MYSATAKSEQFLTLSERRTYLDVQHKAIEHHFVEICRERMTKAEFKILMHEASIRARATEQEAADWLAKNP